MVGTTKTYMLVYLCMILLVLGAPNKLAYTSPQYNEPIDAHLIFNATVMEQTKELEAVLGRIKCKKDTIEQQTQELERITHKAKTNDQPTEIYNIGDSRSEYIFTDNLPVQRVQSRH